MNQHEMQFEWSESGRELLRNITNEIENIGGRGATYHTLIIESSKSPIKISLARKYLNDNKRKRKKEYAGLFGIKGTWNDDEVNFLMDNSFRPLSELKMLFPERTLAAINSKRTRTYIKQQNQTK